MGLKRKVETPPEPYLDTDLADQLFTFSSYNESWYGNRSLNNVIYKSGEFWAIEKPSDSFLLRKYDDNWNRLSSVTIAHDATGLTIEGVPSCFDDEWCFYHSGQQIRIYDYDGNFLRYDSVSNSAESWTSSPSGIWIGGKDGGYLKIHAPDGTQLLNSYKEIDYELNTVWLHKDLCIVQTVNDSLEQSMYAVGKDSTGSYTVQSIFGNIPLNTNYYYAPSIMAGLMRSVGYDKFIRSEK